MTRKDQPRATVTHRPSSGLCLIGKPALAAEPATVETTLRITAPLLLANISWTFAALESESVMVVKPPTLTTSHV